MHDFLGHHIGKGNELGKVFFVTDRFVGNFLVLVTSCHADDVTWLEIVTGLWNPLVEFVYVNLVRGQSHGSVAD